MIDYKYKDFYNDTSVSKRMQIQCSDGSVLNEDDWNYISASTVKADYMEVSNWTSSGVIKADKISAATIVNKLSSVDLVSVRAIGVSGYMNYKGTVVAWRTKTISGNVITYLGPED